MWGWVFGLLGWSVDWYWRHLRVIWDCLYMRVLYLDWYGMNFRVIWDGSWLCIDSCFECLSFKNCSQFSSFLW